jgi:archaellum biogenesis protein FlaJ (TadC family)
MDHFQVDYGSVLIAALLYMVIGFFWYSKWLFGTLWMKLSGIKESDMKHNRLAPLWGFIVALVMAFFLAYFEAFLGVTTVSDGMFVGFCLWLGFVATTQLTPVIWCKESPQLFLINTGSKLLSLLVMGGVLGA